MSAVPSMPIDIKKLLEAVGNIGQERDKNVRIDLVFDPTANSVLVDMIIAAFIDVQSDAQIRDMVLGNETPSISGKSDLCIVVGGDSMLLGDVVDAARMQEVPAVVVIARGKTFFADSPQNAQKYAESTVANRSVSNVAGTAQAPAVVKGIPLECIIDVDVTPGASRPLEELGTWILQNVSSKRLALASRFPFLHHPLAIELGKENTIQNGVIGFIFFVPGADMPLITLNQTKMLIQIATIYGRPLNRERIKEVIVVVVSGFGFRAISRRLVSLIPVLGWLIKPVVAASGTMAMAAAAVEYYEEDGKLHGLTGAVDKAWDKAEPLVDKGVDAFGKVIKRSVPNVTI